MSGSRTRTMALSMLALGLLVLSIGALGVPVHGLVGPTYTVVTTCYGTSFFNCTYSGSVSAECVLGGLSYLCGPGDYVGGFWGNQTLTEVFTPMCGENLTWEFGVEYASYPVNLTVSVWSPSGLRLVTQNAILNGTNSIEGLYELCSGATTNPPTTPTTLTLSCTNSSMLVGSVTTCNAAVEGAGSTPTGSVYWSYSGTGAVSFSATECTLSEGSCSMPMKGSYPGTVAVRADYSGSSNHYQGSSGSAKLTILKTSPTITTTLSHIAVLAGQSVSDSATLKGGFQAGGTVTYEYFPGGTCTGAPTNVGSPVIVTNGLVPVSISKTFNTIGIYSWKAVYSGDANNTAAISPCEPLTVGKASPTITTTLSHLAILASQSVYDSATLKGSYQAGGTVTYEYFSGGTCSGAAVNVGATVTVKNGVVPNSASHILSTAGAYSWKAVYSGDTNNKGATSPCEKLTVLKTMTPPTHTTITCTKSSFTVGTKVTCTAVVTGGYIPRTGTITWSKVLGTGKITFSRTTCTLIAGRCSVTLTATARGSVTIQATYSGDLHNPWSSRIVILTIT